MRIWHSFFDTRHQYNTRQNLQRKCHFNGHIKWCINGAADARKVHLPTYTMKILVVSAQRIEFHTPKKLAQKTV